MHVAIVSHLLKFYINVINLVNVYHLIYCILINFSVSLRINFSDIFHYFCEDKTPKFKT